MNFRRLLFFLPMAVLPLLFLTADDWVWPDGSGIIHAPEVSDDGTAYQLKFLTVPGVNYTIESSEDLNTWTPDITYRGIGHTIIHPLLALPQNDGSPTPPPTNEEPPEPMTPASLRIQPILTSADPSATQTGLSVRWYSLDDEEPRHYILHGQTIEENPPPLYAEEFQPYTFFLQFPGQITDPSTVSPSDNLGPKDAAMISKLLDSLPAINTQIAANAANASATPTAPPAPGSKGFYRIRRTYVDSDSDGIQDHLEDQQGTDMWNWDTDGDGISDSQDQNPLVNDAVADPDGTGLPASLETGLLARYDFESLQGTFPNNYYEDKSGNNRPATPFAMGIDSHGMVSKAAKTTAGYAELDGTIWQGKTQYALSLWVCFDKDSIKTAPTGATQGLFGIYDYVNELSPQGYLIKEYNLWGLRIEKQAGGQELWKLGGYAYDTDPNNDGIPDNPVTANEDQTMSFTQPEGSIDDGKWHHITVVRDHPQLRVYIDGILKKQENKAVINLNHSATTEFCFGRYMEYLPTTQFKGKLDRMRIYGRDLTNSEVTALHQQDIDNDGLWDISENKSLLWRDTNGDGIRTAPESHYTINPFRWDKPNSDHDDDGILSITEQTDGTEISNPDTDGDLIPDGWEKDNGLDPTDATDGLLDSDNDGVTNRDEYSYNTDPNGTGGTNSDSDGDGTGDAAEIAQGSHPGDARDGGQPISPEERLTIKLGIGDKSGSESEDYVLHVYRIDPITGEEKRYYTLRSGGHGQYQEETKSIFWKNDTYTFQIDWQSSNLGSSSDPTNPEGADYDYNFIVEPQNDTTGILIDQYDPALKRAVPETPIAGNKSDVEPFKETVEKKRLLRTTAHLIPDYNRDGKIDEADEGKITTSNPYRFWVNNDGDFISKPVDVPLIGTGDSSVDFKINGIRDLIDFFPIKLDIKQALEMFPSPQYTYTLESDGGSFNFVETDLRAETVDNYLIGQLGDPAVPDNANGIVVISQVRQEEFVKTTNEISGKLSADYLKKISLGNIDGIILFEANKVSQNPLKLVIRKGKTKKIAEFEIAMSMNHVENMYRHISLMTEDDLVAGEHAGRPTETAEPSAYPDSLSNQKYFVFLHGYNVNGHQARGWHAEFFKRMWWSGSRARFVGVTWHGSETQGGLGQPDPLPSLIPGSLTPNYHINVDNALKTSDGLATALTSLNGDVTIAAHSLGKMVVSSAIHDHAAPISKYFLIDSAVAIEAYDANAPIQATMTHPEWEEGYPSQAICSEWHLLPWPNGDGRRLLTWRGRLSNRRNTTYYNFYSSGEEVLKNHTNANAFDFFSFTDAQLVEALSGDGATGIYSWAFQEKLKGRTLTGHVQGSRWGGWGFNIQRKPAPTVGWNPAHAATFTAQEMMENPYWRRGGEDAGVTEPHPTLFTVGSAGSNYAISHRDLLLAEGFPARTNAAGANPLAVLGGGNNFDMMDMKNGWHNGGITDWLHSDITGVSYLFTNKVYKKFVELGELKQ